MRSTANGDDDDEGGDGFELKFSNDESPVVVVV
jgi:hypothetical protein